ncbi:hypothetical protein [Streptacidiphilus albus]|uniref:hypothetical protein n=1 Tax=Streptacidiphilus albus TaxID=105425 RepID=UPI000689CC49|nr:hypothetical protein [Streptacidiphilus albus]
MRPFRQRNRSVPGSSQQDSSTQQYRSDQHGGDPAEEFLRVAAELDVLDGSAPADPVLVDGAAPAARRGRGRVVDYLVTTLMDTAPRIPVRDLAALRAQHPDALTPEDLADRLTSGAAKAAATVGAGVGAAAMLPVPPAMTVEIASEVVGVAAVEVKLIAELYAVYGQPVPGNGARRTGAYLAVWGHRRGLDLSRPASVAALTGGVELRRQLRKRIFRSGLRSLPTLAPMMVGAAAGAVLNRRDTLKLAAEIRRDLRSRPPLDRDYWS